MIVRGRESVGVGRKRSISFEADERREEHLRLAGRRHRHERLRPQQLPGTGGARRQRGLQVRAHLRKLPGNGEAPQEVERLRLRNSRLPLQPVFRTGERLRVGNRCLRQEKLQRGFPGAGKGGGERSEHPPCVRVFEEQQ